MSSAQTKPEIRAQALEAYQRVGLAEAVRSTGIPKTTLRRWAREEGLDTSALHAENVERTEAARAARAVYVAALREDLRALFLETAVDMLERTREPHIDFRGKDSNKVTFDQAPAPACREYVWAAGIALDKFRLEMGESTSKVEVERGPLEQQVNRIAGMRDELRDRKERKAGEERQAG